ncbi:MAG: thermonuclease family protein [Methylotenera sp.]|nr:thermonuclease family protein [Methylotenera sp.]
MALIHLCQGEHMLVTAQIVGEDRYQRALGRLQCNHVDASLYLLERGWAWHSAKFNHDSDLANATPKAQALRLGLWADGQPIAPWHWRHAHPH